MTDTPIRYQVRDDHLPDRPPLAVADTYLAALEAVEVLHRQFRVQIAASGEGGTGALQRLAVEELSDAGEVVCRYLSSVSGQ